MKVVADPNIAQVGDAFAEFGDLELIPGREIGTADVADAQVLVVRAVTGVDERLLSGSQVRWVGTATAGIDHIDTKFLSASGIGFASAPGSNARSVAEYVLSAVMVASETGQRAVHETTIGVIGFGAVGRRLVGMLEAAGATCVVNDPPLAGETERALAPLDEALQADIVSVHVPLTEGGPWPTRNLLDASRLGQLRSEAVLINAARGGIIDEKALLARMEKYPAMQVYIDCWQNEPEINAALLRAATLATAHVAGYSYEGKLAATRMLHDAACDYFGHSGQWQLPAESKLRLDQPDLLRSVLSCYDIRQDSAALKSALNLDAAARERHFDQLRRDYPRRHEFSAYRIPRGLAAGEQQRMAALGFSLD